MSQSRKAGTQAKIRQIWHKNQRDRTNSKTASTPENFPTKYLNAKNCPKSMCSKLEFQHLQYDLHPCQQKHQTCITVNRNTKPSIYSSMTCIPVNRNTKPSIYISMTCIPVNRNTRLASLSTETPDLHPCQQNTKPSIYSSMTCIPVNRNTKPSIYTSMTCGRSQIKIPLAPGFFRDWVIPVT